MGNLIVCCSSIEAREPQEDSPEPEAAPVLDLPHLPVLGHSLSERTLPVG